MSITLSITTEVVQDHTSVIATVTGTTGIDSNIFVFKNTGTSALGGYVGVVNLAEIQRFKVYNPSTPTKAFGNKFLRYYTATIVVPAGVDPATVVTTITANVKALSTAYNAQVPVTTTVTV